jgi:soluble lytic murein transglycosylase-like protein
MRLLPGCLAVLLPLAAARAAPLQALSPALLCEQAIAAAEFRGRTPPGMLAAIAHVESGRPDPDTGAIRPWPWTINVGGAGQYFATKAQAIAAVTALQAQGVRSIDVGCMQVNLMHHPDAFATLAAAFDPPTNAAYAVRFLTQLDAQTGDWRRAVAAYHSNTPEIGADYQRRVLALWRPTPGALAAPPAAALTHEAGGGLVYGTMGNSGRVYGLIMPTVRLNGGAGGPP